VSDLFRRRGAPASFVLLMGAMAALPAIATDMYLPSLPEVARELDTTAALVQATITGVLIGGAIGQLLIGPLSDRFGRRPPVLIGLAIHVLMSVLCAMAAGIAPLIALRVLQGVGNASAMTTAMAVVRDRYTGATAAGILSRLMLVIGVAPLLAPAAGSFIAQHSSWRGVFVALALLGVALWVVVWRYLPETRPPAPASTPRGASTLRTYGRLLRDRSFITLAVLPALIMSVLISYIVASPFVFRGQFGMAPTEFSLFFALNGIALVLGSQANAALVRRVAPLQVMRVALPASLALAAGLFLVTLRDNPRLVEVAIPLWLLIGVNALTPPNATALALSRHGERAASAAALIGAMQAAVAGLVSPLVGVVGTGANGMAIVVLGLVTTAALVFVGGVGAYRRGHDQGADGAQ